MGWEGGKGDRRVIGDRLAGGTLCATSDDRGDFRLSGDDKSIKADSENRITRLTVFLQVSRIDKINRVRRVRSFRDSRFMSGRRKF